MKPLQHAKISAKRHGGKWEDYADLHNFFDLTKAHVADMRHRAILHNSFGIQLLALTYGEVRMNSDGKEYSVRDIGEEHVLQDLGTIPSLAEVINAIGTEHLKWLGGPAVNKRIISWEDLDKKFEAANEAPVQSDDMDNIAVMVPEPTIKEIKREIQEDDFIDGGGAEYRRKAMTASINRQLERDKEIVDKAIEQFESEFVLSSAWKNKEQRNPDGLSEDEEPEDNLPSSKVLSMFQD